MSSYHCWTRRELLARWIIDWLNNWLANQRDRDDYWTDTVPHDLATCSNDDCIHSDHDVDDSCPVWSPKSEGC